MNFQFPFTNHFNLTVLPSLGRTPLHYVVTAGNGLDQLQLILNNSDTYTISLNINYSTPQNGNISYYMYSPYETTVGNIVYFNQTSVWSSRITVIAKQYIPIPNAAELAQQLFPYINQTLMLNNQAQLDRLNQFFTFVTAGLVTSLIGVGGIATYLFWKSHNEERELEILRKRKEIISK